MPSFQRVGKCLCAIGIICSAIVSVRAQEAGDPGSVVGRVSDVSGAVLPGVAAEARPQDGGPSVRTVTDAAGMYRFDELRAGIWDVSFSLPNFASAAVTGVVVKPGAETTVDATLSLRLTAEVIVNTASTFRDLSTITTATDLVGIASSATSGVVTGAQLVDYPVARPGDLAERVPGVIISQHSGEGKANQYYMRGFNIDHGTDLALSVAGLPVNLPTNGHGQGYADLNFMIPELVGSIQYKKGPYYAEEGDFSAAGAIHLNYLNVLDRPVARVEAGGGGYRRVFAAASPRVGSGHLLAAVDVGTNDGPWVRPDGFRKVNGVLRYSQGTTRSGFSVTGMFYDARWDSTDQVPLRAIESGTISRFGLIDGTDGGRSHRHSVVAAWQSGDARSLTRIEGFGSKYGLNLFSNFSYFLGDPVNGDQFEQRDERWLAGLRASHLRVLGQRHPTELTVGMQLRYDDIAPVGLYLTKARQRLATVREDTVGQRSAALYVRANTQWGSTLRTIVGMRGDIYDVDVASDDPLNSGSASATRPSPKVSVVLGPWARTEVYVNYGWGFHSNDVRGATITRDPATGDPADPVDLLVRGRGAEVGVRTLAWRGIHATAAIWSLGLDSELLFVGDAGSTEASRPSARRGVELTVDYSPRAWLKFDASYALSHARFDGDDPVGDHIPGAIEGVFAAGAAVRDLGRWSGGLHVRWFGPRPLIEDNSVRSASSTLINGDVVFRVAPALSIQGSVFNLLDRAVADVDYYYTSRLPGEPLGGVDDIHTHPSPPRTVRVGFVASF